MTPFWLVPRSKILSRIQTETPRKFNVANAHKRLPQEIQAKIPRKMSEIEANERSFQQDSFHLLADTFGKCLIQRELWKNKFALC